MLTAKTEYITFSSKSRVEICNHCGDSVEFGTGKFVNRIPELNDTPTRIANGLLFPKGDFVCEPCDSNPEKFYSNF